MSVLAIFPAPLCPQTPGLEPLHTSVTVTGSITAEAPALVTVIDGKQLEETPGADLDDKLRDIAGFSLFRRTSSVVANPTTQGVSLRGLGSTGASRTLVLLDGLPLNDAFGGWVYWDRIDPGEVARIEVSRGVSTSAFGDRAMGGVVSFFSREPEKLHVTGRYEGGNHSTHEVSSGISNAWSRWAASADARAFTTDGWFIVPGSVRGGVDVPAWSRFAAGGARLDFFGAASRLFLRFDALAEERGNGTVLQQNSTSLGQLAAHYTTAFGANTLSALAYHTRESFRSTYSAIAADRNSERLTSVQRVPAEATGGAGMSGRHTSRYELLAGADANRVEGWNHEAPPGAAARVTGGDIFAHGAFAQGSVAAGPARFYAGARHDFTVGDRKFFSPKAGVSAGHGRARARASVYRSFRAPTLNELYRNFRVGNTLTQANAVLRPETLTGAEAGFDFGGENLRASVTGFRNSLTDLITNVTLSSAPNLIVRQRQNAASALSRGFEAELRPRWRELSAEFSYLFADSRFGTGARIPQVPRHQGSTRVVWSHGRTLAAAGIRSYSAQFEDERNLRSLLLPGFAAIQAYAQRRIAARLSAIVEVENLLDRQYLAGLTPTPMTGAPRLWRAGLRWE